MYAFNKGMFKGYLRHCKAYMEFCQSFGWDLFPLEPEKSAFLVTYLNNGNRNANTIRGYHSSVISVASTLGMKFSKVLLVLKCMKKVSTDKTTGSPHYTIHSENDWVYFGSK